MNRKEMYVCLISCGIAFLMLGLLWSAVGVSANSSDDDRLPHSRKTESSASQGYTATIYLPLVMRHYPYCEDSPALSWASDSGGIFLRWYWPERCEGPATFHIYRTYGHSTVLLAEDIAPVTDPAQAEAILGDAWPAIQSRADISTTSQLHELRLKDPMQATYLANIYHQVAIVYGWGYSDTTVTRGKVYEYAVRAVRQWDGATVDVGKVTAQASYVTPLSAPTGLAVTQVISEDLVGEMDWLKAQRNRKADRRVFLRWNTNRGDDRIGAPEEPWIVGYDVYRSVRPTAGFVPVNDELVIPMPSTRPADLTTTTSYELHDYFFEDDDPTLEYGRTYYYRVAPRDLLGRSRDWPDKQHQDQFSDYVEAVPRDTMPPGVPQDFAATPLYSEIPYIPPRIRLDWTAQTTDTTGYRLYRSWHLTASVLMTPCVDAEICWVPLADISDPTTDYYVHYPVQRELRYWYLIRAVDEAGNLSAPSQPVFAIFQDRVAPDDPVLSYEEAIHIDGPPDATTILLYCSVDGGPQRLWEILPVDENGNALYPVHDEYNPPVPTTLDCQAQAVDASGNRSGFGVLSASILLVPGQIKDPSAPIITAISTKGDATGGWKAVINWEAEPVPGVVGFRLYRQVGDDPANLLADESILERDARSFEDETVVDGVVYSYTVAIYRPDDPPYTELELRSQSRRYEVIPPLGDRSRQIVVMDWDEPYHDSSGTHLRWTGPEPDVFQFFLVFRSLYSDRGYVQLTPPIEHLYYDDDDAEHPHYWYVVLWLDGRAGEVIGRTEPWSAAGGALTATGPDQPQAGTELGGVDKWRVEAAPSPVTPAQALPQALPESLYLGWETEEPPFTLDVESYAAGSTLDNLSGRGSMTLGGEEAGTVVRSFVFSGLGANENGTVCTGSVTITVDYLVVYRGGLTYDVGDLVLDRHSGTGVITVHLPAHIQQVEGGGDPQDVVVLADAVIVHPDLTFEKWLTDLDPDPCSYTTPDLYFEMNPLPLRIVPKNSISYTHMSILFDGGVCTQYEERCNDALLPRPTYPDPDASDTLLRAEYQAAGGKLWIGRHGLEGELGTGLGVTLQLNTAVPFGLYFRTIGEGQIVFEDNQIVDGRVQVSTHPWVDRWIEMPFHSHVPTGTFGFVPPDSRFIGQFDTLYVGRGGALYGVIDPNAEVAWSGFRLTTDAALLYVPPIETQGMPWEEAIGQAPADEVLAFADETGIPVPQGGLEAGLNAIGDVGLTWGNCDREVVFPDGAVADAYLRRGGMSDYFTATIPPGSAVGASLYGYDVKLSRFRVAFFDNELYDRDIAADMDIPEQADIILPLIDLNIDCDGCVRSALVRQGTHPVLGWWQIKAHPTSIEFRPDSDPAFPDDQALWILGRVEIPHMALPTDDGSVPDYESGLPLDLSLTPTGDFHEFEWKEESGRYLFDGFDFLIEEISLSDQTDDPGWDPSATLGEPPCEGSSCTQGFVALKGHLLTPLFGALKADGGRPVLQFMVDSDFVGFTERPQVKRGFTKKAGLGFVFDLVYVHDVDAHIGHFVAWDQEGFFKTNSEKLEYVADYLDLFTLDWATVISPTETGVHFGLSTVPAVVHALAQATMVSVPVSFTLELSQTAWTQWFPALDITETLPISEARGYLDLTSRLWATMTQRQKTPSEVIDALEDKDIPTAPSGGGTQGLLADKLGIKIGKVRGQASFTSVFDGADQVDWDLEELHISLQISISWGMPQTTLSQRSSMPPPYAVAAAAATTVGDDEDEDSDFVLLQADRLTFRITRDGEYIMEGERASSDLADKDTVKAIDFSLLLVPEREDFRFEGGLTLYEVTIEGVYFERLTGVLGVGKYQDNPFVYVGANGEAKPKFDTLKDVKLGGGFLVGTIYPDDIVLRNMGYADLLDKLIEIPNYEEGVFVGAYIRAYGDLPLISEGCVRELTLGAEIAVWLFRQVDNGHWGSIWWGGRLRGYIHGKLLCLISGRGDLTLELYRPGYTDVSRKKYALRGHFWIAGGVGFCSPGSWHSWESRWWGDSWCYCVGAFVSVEYNVGKPNDWDFVSDTDYE